ncbi:dienelactone hydrolase family protein [Candidatus Sumerlaeota bacterium]|nr:dienelactone hydrolase family protein [Candidatus Sumerlaeota bacterium]
MKVLPGSVKIGRHAGWREIVCGFIIVSVSARLLWAAELPDPRKPGPYPVGVTTMELVDSSRTDALTKGPRTLLTDIWYPATDDAKNLPKNKFSDFFLSGANPELNGMLEKFFKVKIEEVDKRFHNKAVRDARVREGKFPLIVFSHGNGGIRSQNAFWCDHLASHGYVVMSCDHTGNCAATVVDGKVIPYNVSRMMASATERPKDVSFLIDRMAKMNSGTDSRFTNRIDMNKIGVAGHSYGGFTAASVIESDPRVKAIIPMTPVWQFRTNFTTPVFIFIATEDKTIGLLGNNQVRKRYEESQGPHYMVEIPDGGHFTFTDMFQADPNFGDGVGKGVRVTRPGEELIYLPEDISHEITDAYSVAFFGVYVKGETGYKSFLAENHYGDKIIYKAGEPATVSAGSAGGSQ